MQFRFFFFWRRARSSNNTNRNHNNNNTTVRRSREPYAGEMNPRAKQTVFAPWSVSWCTRRTNKSSAGRGKINIRAYGGEQEEEWKTKIIIVENKTGANWPGHASRGRRARDSSAGPESSGSFVPGELLDTCTRRLPHRKSCFLDSQIL